MSVGGIEATPESRTIAGWDSGVPIIRTVNRGYVPQNPLLGPWARIPPLDKARDKLDYHERLQLQTAHSKQEFTKSHENHCRQN